MRGPPSTTHPVVDISFLFAIDSSICAPKKGTEEDRWKVVVIHRECCRLLLEVHLHYQLTLLVQPSSSFLFLELVPPSTLRGTNLVETTSLPPSSIPRVVGGAPSTRATSRH